MIKILFVMTNLRKGGIATSLVNLLNFLSLNENYELTLYLFDYNLNFDYSLSPKIKIIFGNKYSSLLSNSIKDSKKFGVSFYILRNLLSLFAFFFTYKLAYQYLFTKFPIANDYYDIAVSSSQSSPLNRLYGGCNEFLISKIKSRKYVTFVHTDISKHKINTSYTHNLMKKFNFIVTVSNSLKKNLQSILTNIPDYKFFVIENLHNLDNYSDYKPIIDKTPSNTINILTVSRASKEKGLNRLLKVSKLLKKEKIKFNWIVIGDGSYLTKYIRLTKKFKISDVLHFIGKKDNPIPYYIKTDLFVLPSNYEGAPMVLEEAKIFGCYLLSTNTISANEIVGNDYGKVCKISTNDIFLSIIDIINNKKYINFFGTQIHKDFILSLKKRKEDVLKIIYHFND